MDKSNLTPFLHKNLDILFVGLNPAKGSSDNRHYFSVNSAFWNQLYESGLITKRVRKDFADKIVFGSTAINKNHWKYGITDLITTIAESNSNRIKPVKADAVKLEKVIREIKPRIVVLLHKKVNDTFLPYLGIYSYTTNQGYLGKILKECNSEFYTIAFPHGNTISKEEKIKHYKSIINTLQKN